LQRAIEIVQRAMGDLKQNYAEAYKQYQNSLDCFMLALKYEKNDKLKALIKSEVTEYLDRAEKLKVHLSSHEKRSKFAVSVDGKGASTGKKCVTLRAGRRWRLPGPAQSTRRADIWFRLRSRGDGEDGDDDPDVKKLRAGLAGPSLFVDRTMTRSDARCIYRRDPH
ncbi:hypothetical protein EXIGLDRAFT_618008, partial [Exidia glandulosa HHB12029]